MRINRLSQEGRRSDKPFFSNMSADFPHKRSLRLIGKQVAGVDRSIGKACGFSQVKDLMKAGE